MPEDLISPAALSEALERKGIVLSRALGQNFLVDGNIRRLILEAADLGPDDSVLEVGGGAGILTGELARETGHLTVIEKDGRMLDILRPLVAASPDGLLIHEDAMDVDITAIMRERCIGKMVANLPYSIASPLLIRVLEADGCLRLIICTVQKEVADRLAAAPGGRDYSLLTALVGMLADVRLIRRLTPHVFYPKPKVDSAVISVVPRGLPEDYPTARELARMAFSQRRKMMAGNLATGLALPRCEVEGAMAEAGIAPDSRAEGVSPSGWLALAGVIRKAGHALP